MPKVKLPKYMKRKKLRSGDTSYYLTLPPEYKGKVLHGHPCPLPFNTPLGTDFAQACARHGRLIQQWDSWLAGERPTAAEGTVDWVIAKYKSSTAYEDLAVRTRKDYDLQLARLSDYITPKRGHKFGLMRAATVRPGMADKIFEDLLEAHGDRQASYTMQVARKVWNWAKRKDFVTINPFLSMGLKLAAKEPTYAPSREEYEKFKNAARDMGLQNVAAAAALAFELVQRGGDVIGRKDDRGNIVDAMKWSDYRPGEWFEIIQNKTGVRLRIPMYDDDGAQLFPELEAELAQTPKMGAYIVMDPAHKSGVTMPMDEWKFRRLVRSVREKAGLDKKFVFKGLRHGGATELGDAGVADVSPLTGHTNLSTTRIYNQHTPKKAAAAARKRQLLKAEISDALQELRGK